MNPAPRTAQSGSETPATSTTSRQIEDARTMRARALRFALNRYQANKKAVGISDGRDDAEEFTDARTDESSISNNP